MILEIADVRVTPGREDDFAQAIAQALGSVMARAPGALAWQVHRCIETPARFVLQIQWAQLEDHTVGFRESPLFAEWRAIIGPFFALPPLVEHFTLVDTPAR
jgi:heme-degrading monooxygenase HmoA